MKKKLLEIFPEMKAQLGNLGYMDLLELHSEISGLRGELANENFIPIRLLLVDLVDKGVLDKKPLITIADKLEQRVMASIEKLCTDLGYVPVTSAEDLKHNLLAEVQLLREDLA